MKLAGADVKASEHGSRETALVGFRAVSGSIECRADGGYTMSKCGAAIILERAAFLRSSLDKLDLDNVAESEKVQLLTELGNLRKLIDHLLK